MDYEKKIDDFTKQLKQIESAYIKCQAIIEFLTVEKETEEKTKAKKTK